MVSLHPVSSDRRRVRKIGPTLREAPSTIICILSALFRDPSPFVMRTIARGEYIQERPETEDVRTDFRFCAPAGSIFRTRYWLFFREKECTILSRVPRKNTRNNAFFREGRRPKNVFTGVSRISPLFQVQLWVQRQRSCFCCSMTPDISSPNRLLVLSWIVK